MERHFIIAMVALTLTSCATGRGAFGSASRITQLRPGMTSTEVTSILGQPASSHFLEGHLVWRYDLHRYWMGWIPYYLAFEPNSMKLVGWFENMSEYYANQHLWLEAMPKQHNVSVQGNLKHDVTGVIQHDVDIR